MDEDRTSVSGTHSNDTIIELTGATAANENASLPETKNVCNNAGPSLEAQEGPRGAVVAPGLMLLDLLKLKKRKIGHRRVNEEGEVTFKKIQTSWIVGSIQLGIGQAVGSLASKPERDLLMMDFALVETMSFPKEGGPVTPAHRYSDFKFRAYAPVAFRYFRDLFGIQPGDFLSSLCSRPMLQLTNPGASGSIFYVTDDDNFVLKTVDHREAEFLQKLLPGYYMNINQNPRTLLPKFFGLYCYQCSNKNVRLVVMNNLLPAVKLHEKYDLKGSTYKRKAGRAERKKSSPTYKDLDFLERHPEGIFLEPETYSALLGTMRRDCRVLESFKIMDYSLLVGVHNLDADTQCREEENKTLARSRSMNRQRLAAFSTALESIRADVDVPEGGQGGEDVPPGGIPARNAKGERLLLFLGIIDILQSFVLKKRLEHTFKAIVHDGDTVSVHRPGFYAQRFLDFMANAVFKKAPSPLKHTPSRRRGRKASGAAPAKSDPSFEEKISAVPQKEADPGTSFDASEEPDPTAGTSFCAVEDPTPDEIAAIPKRNANSGISLEEPISRLAQVKNPGISFGAREDRIANATSPKQEPTAACAETNVLDLSQVIIETVDVGGPSMVSTPTHTEGTPSLTESSPSPTTPLKGIGKSFDSLGPLDETRVQ